MSDTSQLDGGTPTPDAGTDADSPDIATTHDARARKLKKLKEDTESISAETLQAGEAEHQRTKAANEAWQEDEKRIAGLVKEGVSQPVAEAQVGLERRQQESDEQTQRAQKSLEAVKKQETQLKMQKASPPPFGPFSGQPPTGGSSAGTHPHPTAVTGRTLHYESAVPEGMSQRLTAETFSDGQLTPPLDELPPIASPSAQLGPSSLTGAISPAASQGPDSAPPPYSPWPQDGTPSQPGDDSPGAAGSNLSQGAGKQLAKPLQGAAKEGYDALAKSIGGAVDKLATYSKAEQELSKNSRTSASEQQAAVEAQIQAFLGQVAKKDTVRALEETAEGIAALAMGNPAAAGHFASAAMFGAIAGGAAGAGAAVGAGRPNAQQEDQQLAQPRGNAGAGGSGAGGSGGPILINFNTGGGLFVTTADVAKGVAQAMAQAARLR